MSSTWSVRTPESGQTIDTRIGVEAAVEAHQLSDAMAGHDPNTQCTPGRQALVAPVPASDPLQLLPLVGVEEDLQALTHLMSFTEHYGRQYATARDLARTRTEVSLLMRPQVHARTVHGASPALTIAITFGFSRRTVVCW